MARKLRIAVSVFFAVLSIAFCVLWVRSYAAIEVVGGSWRPSYCIVGADKGELGIIMMEPATHEYSPWHWSSDLFEPGDELFILGDKDSYVVSKPGFSVARTSWGSEYVVSFWLLVLCNLLIAAAIWIRVPERFSLRTLLIATTLVAVVLGLGVWASG